VIPPSSRVPPLPSIVFQSGERPIQISGSNRSLEERIMHARSPPISWNPSLEKTWAFSARLGLMPTANCLRMARKVRRVLRRRFQRSRKSHLDDEDKRKERKYTNTHINAQNSSVEKKNGSRWDFV